MTPNQLPQEVSAKTTALGRPMRKSASQFAAWHLLKSRANDFGHLGASDSSTDEDWNPMRHNHDSSPSSSPGHVGSSQRLSLQKKPQVFKRPRLFSPSIVCSSYFPFLMENVEAPVSEVQYMGRLVLNSSKFVMLISIEVDSLHVI
ncbi:unnamed protein product [Schistocephalus solidus]|uniref:Uncharacterized protein n=1 Tax=Schistocephalus solidus TaxID=70667 RepID=A0A183SAU6_SCHSO|nr:unnamed protein product [Schistocephalus solidus]